MSDLILTIPKAGLLSMLDYIDSGLSVKFAYIGLGNGRITANDDTLIMGNLITKLPVVNGMVNKENACLNINAMGQPQQVHEVNEIGLFNDRDELIAVHSLAHGYFFKTNIDTLMLMTVAVGFTQDLADRAAKIKLSFSPNEQLLHGLLYLHDNAVNPHPFYKHYALEKLNQHLADANPHDMYALRDMALSITTDINNRLDALYRVFTGLLPDNQHGIEYAVGTHELIIPANRSIEVHLVGAGGSGAGSLWASNITANWLKMDSGQDSLLVVNDAAVIAGGGEGGTRGVWNNGSAYLQGVAGVGGKVVIPESDSFRIITRMDGENAYLETAHDWCNRDTRGGLTRYTGGQGGEGGYTVETRKHRCYGAGGGSGGYVHFEYHNKTDKEVKAVLIVGNSGLPDTITNELNNGKSGQAGYAMARLL